MFEFCNNFGLYFRPGGELNPAEDEVEGLKRLLTEVIILFINVNTYYNYLYFMVLDFRQTRRCSA